jgi:hypothetical protein
MIDLTTLQANPIPLAIMDLQAANVKLENQNNTLRNIVIAGSVIAALYFGDKLLSYLKNKNEQRNNQIQLPRD